MALFSKIIATGSYLPKKILTNDDLAKIVDTSDDWIRSRTGITKRHIAADDEYTSHMAANAALNALKNANISSAQIDMIIVATTTPDNTFPSTATKVQHLIKASNACAFDVQAVCSGFIYALAIADNFIKSGQRKNILVIGAEKMSSILNWQDRTTCVLFGDGAGAVILSANTDNNSGIISTNLHSDGDFYDILYTDGGTSLNKTAGHIQMNGQEVFKHAVSKMSATINESLSNNNFTLADITWLVPHQANLRILEMVGKRLHINDDRVINYVAEHANTSAASIPLALDLAVKNNKFKSGDLLALTAIGGGITWGSALIRW